MTKEEREDLHRRCRASGMSSRDADEFVLLEEEARTEAADALYARITADRGGHMKESEAPSAGTGAQVFIC